MNDGMNSATSTIDCSVLFLYSIYIAIFEQSMKKICYNSVNVSDIEQKFSVLRVKSH